MMNVDTLQLSREVIAALGQPAPAYDLRNAEVLNVEPCWYAIEVYAGAYERVARELEARQFGIYVPELVSRSIRRGRRVDELKQMMPGYIFAFIWGGVEHGRRIASIPGVLGFVRSDGRPAAISDDAIAIVRMVESGALPPLKWTVIKRTSTRRKRRRKKETNKAGGLISTHNDSA